MLAHHFECIGEAMQTRLDGSLVLNRKSECAPRLLEVFGRYRLLATDMSQPYAASLG
ncbi:MAG: hypothetical protein OXF33_01460 [Rhodospirillales bacterium]|nr:hypothetical protein [Rhodospirillales bacterium]